MPTKHPGEKSPKIPAEETFLFKMADIAADSLLLQPKIMYFFSIFVMKRHLGVHTHVLKYRKHNGIIIPTLVLTLQMKIQYGRHF